VTGGFFPGRAPELTRQKTPNLRQKTLDNRHWTEAQVRKSMVQSPKSMVFGGA